MFENLNRLSGAQFDTLESIVESDSGILRIEILGSDIFLLHRKDFYTAIKIDKFGKVESAERQRIFKQ